MSAVPDLTGQSFGRLNVVRRSGTRSKQAMWLCSCSCNAPDAILEVSGSDLRRGHTRSCGCLLGDVIRAMGGGRRTHGHSAHGRSRTYVSWEAMHQRCRNPNKDGFERYGGRGITVCERWRDFENFLADMGERPAGKTLDRYPNPDGDYEPLNCRWATPKEQQANRCASR